MEATLALPMEGHEKVLLVKEDDDAKSVCDHPGIYRS